MDSTTLVTSLEHSVDTSSPSILITSNSLTKGATTLLNFSGEAVATATVGMLDL